MSNPYPSPSSRPLEQLKVAELRDELRKRGLSLKGVKKELLERLDEAVRQDQAGTVSSVSEIVEDQAKDGHVVDELEGEHGITPSAGHPPYENNSENIQDGDCLPNPNDSENPSQDSALIVNNVLPCVGAPDATPVFMESCKDAEEPNLMSEQIKVDASPMKSLDGLSSGAVPDSVNVDAGDVSRPDSLVLENNAVLAAGDDNQVAEKIASVEKQCSGNEAILPGKESNDFDLPEESCQSTGDVVGLPESVSQAGGNDSLFAAPEASNMDSILSTDGMSAMRNCAADGDDVTVGGTVTLVQKAEGTELTNQFGMAIPSAAVIDDPNLSVSDDPLGAADASLPASSCIVLANDSTVQDDKTNERTSLVSVVGVSSVHEPVEDFGSPKVKSAEDTKQVELLESGEASLPLSAHREAPEMPPAVAISEGVQDPGLKQNIVIPESLQDPATHEVVQDVVVQEVHRDTEMLESLQDSTMHEVVQEGVAQEAHRDTEMSEVLESPSVKVEVSGMVVETKPIAVSVDALDHSTGLKPENFGSLLVTDFNQPNETVRDMVLDGGKPNVKLEPVESETRAGRRIFPVESVKVELQDVKEDLRKSSRSLERSRQKESEYERSKYESSRASAYGNERNRTEGRSGRVFREERRKDPKDKELKPVQEEYSDRSGQKRKDDERDAQQQEPAKRVRRWNSENQLVVETAKPSTAGTVKEMESKKEGFAVAPPKLTPKLSGPSRPPPPATAKTNSEANGVKRAVPPSTRAPTSSLKVERFVRPFTLKAVKDLLSEFGQCVDFWMDQIKTHCYVMYSKVDEAVAARNGLYDKQWPPSFGNLLVADFVDPSEVKIRSDGSFEKMNASPVTTPREFPNRPQPLDSFHGYSNALASAPPPRERQLMQVPMKEPEPPVPTLDDLFRKTRAKPHIYYLPLTDEQVTEKLASVKNKEQQQAKSKPLGRV